MRTDLETLKAKWDSVKKSLADLKARSRCTPRPPNSLIWLVEETGTPKGFAHIGYECGQVRIQSVLVDEPPDKLARTFCALERLDEWIVKAKAGQARHQAEIERQASAAIVRMRTHAAMSS